MISKVMIKFQTQFQIRKVMIKFQTQFQIPLQFYRQLKKLKLVMWQWSEVLTGTTIFSTFPF